MAEAPKYQEIVDDLRRRIASGELAPGALLPSEKELAKQHNCSIQPARTALKVLGDEGLIDTRHGFGTVVRERKPILRDATARLSSSTWAAGKSIWDAEMGGRSMTVDSLTVEAIDAPDWVERALGADRVVVRDRRYVVDGRPIQLATSYLDAALAAGTPIERPDPGEGGIYARLADLGAAPRFFVEQVRARVALPDEARRLRLPRGRAVVEIVRTAMTEDERVVEVNRMVLEADSYVLQYSFTS